MDGESDEEISPEIEIKTRKRLLPEDNDSSQDLSHLFRTNNNRHNTRSSFCAVSYLRSIWEKDKILCCVLSTFTLDLDHLIQEMPFLISSTATINCMIIYGKFSNSLPAGSSQALKHSPLLHLVEVSPQHRRTSHMGFVQNASHLMGVHHPKYALVFIPSGVHVIVTTSNFTPSQNSTDISWVQFFPLRSDPKLCLQFEKDDNLRDSVHSINDFGTVLEDFIVQVHISCYP